MTVTLRQLSKDASADEKARVRAVLYDGFMTYPPHLQLWSKDPETNNALFNAITQQVLKVGEAWVAEDAGEMVGVALWGSPGAELCAEEDVGLLFGPAFTSVAERDAALGSFVTDTLFPGMTDLFNKETPRAELEWWVCYMLAVLPRHQGKGIGSMLLQHRVEHSSGVPMMLNTQTEHNVEVYKKNGYAIRAETFYTLPNGEPYHDRFMSNPPDAKTSMSASASVTSASVAA